MGEHAFPPTGFAVAWLVTVLYDDRYSTIGQVSRLQTLHIHGIDFYENNDKKKQEIEIKVEKNPSALIFQLTYFR